MTLLVYFIRYIILSFHWSIIALAGSECQRNDTLKLATLTLDIWQIVTLQFYWWQSSSLACHHVRAVSGDYGMLGTWALVFDLFQKCTICTYLRKWLLMVSGAVPESRTGDSSLLGISELVFDGGPTAHFAPESDYSWCQGQRMKLETLLWKLTWGAAPRSWPRPVYSNRLKIAASLEAEKILNQINHP